jgi:hypothetical protein
VIKRHFNSYTEECTALETGNCFIIIQDGLDVSFWGCSEGESGVAAMEEKKIAERRNSRMTGEKVFFMYSSLFERNLHS